jgi:hypothetical protein
MKLAFLLKIFYSISAQIARQGCFLLPKGNQTGFFMPLLHLHPFCGTMSYTVSIQSPQKTKLYRQPHAYRGMSLSIDLFR